jgi:hypothetical protein
MDDDEKYGIGSAIQFFGADDYPMPTNLQAYLGSGDQEGDYPMPTNPQNYLGSGDQPGDYPMPTNPQTPGAFGGMSLEKLLKGLTSPSGIAGLGGAALGFLDRAKPSGGGTAQAYQGPMDLTRTMVQGPYGPLAEYKSPFFTGSPDYQPFTGPKIAPTPGAAPAPGPAAPSRSIDSKIAEYRQLASYGLPNDRIRRIAETFYGPQTDADWAELTRLAGGTGGIKTAAPPPAAAPAAAPDAAPAAAPAPASGIATLTPATQSAPMSNYDTRIAMDYINLRKTSGNLDDAKTALESKYGPQAQDILDRYENAYKENLAYQQAQQTPAAAPVAAPAPPPVAATPAAPQESEGYRFATQQGGIGEEKFYENIANFLQANPSEEEQRAAMQEYGISEADVYRAKMKYNLLDGGGFYDQSKPPGMAKGGAVQMEDGGFVMTKRAVDGAGGPPGIRNLLPDARMIRGPGTGTSDDIPAVINGRNGQTPAKLSNGEAYVPPGRDSKGLYALMKQLERKA